MNAAITAKAQTFAGPDRCALTMQRGAKTPNRRSHISEPYGDFMRDTRAVFTNPLRHGPYSGGGGKRTPLALCGTA